MCLFKDKLKRGAFHSWVTFRRWQYWYNISLITFDLIANFVNVVAGREIKIKYVLNIADFSPLAILTQYPTYFYKMKVHF